MRAALDLCSSLSGQPRGQGGQQRHTEWHCGSLLLQAVLGHSLCGQLSQHILQVVGVRLAVASHVAVHLRFVVDLVPHYGVCLACGVGRPDCEDESPLPGHLQELQDLSALGIVWEVALAGEPSGGKWLPRVGVFRALQEEHRMGGLWQQPAAEADRHRAGASAPSLPGWVYACTQGPRSGRPLPTPGLPPTSPTTLLFPR